MIIISKLIGEIEGFEVAPFIRSITKKIKEFFTLSGAQGIIMNIDGGVDSSVSVLLCSRSITGTKVHGIYLMDRGNHIQKDQDDINRVAQIGKFKLSTVEVTRFHRYMIKDLPMLSLGKIPDDILKTAERNLLIRTKAALLYHYSNIYNCIVCGTIDRSDWQLGYFTKWGGSAADFFPLATTYKTQVAKVARALKVGSIAFKPSFSHLWRDDLNQDEVLSRYDEIDPILFGIERGMKDEDIAQDTGLRLDGIKRVRERVISTYHKRQGFVFLSGEP